MTAWLEWMGANPGLGVTCLGLSAAALYLWESRRPKEPDKLTKLRIVSIILAMMALLAIIARFWYGLGGATT